MKNANTYAHIFKEAFAQIKQKKTRWLSHDMVPYRKFLSVEHKVNLGESFLLFLISE